MLPALYDILLLPVIAMGILYAFMARVLPLRKGWQWRVPAALAVTAGMSALKLCWGFFSVPSYFLRLAAVPVLLVLLPLRLFEGPVWKCLLVHMLLYCVQMLGEAFCIQLCAPSGMAGSVELFYRQMSVSQLLIYGALCQGSTVLLDCAIVLFGRTLRGRRFSPVYLSVLLLPLCLWGMLLGHFVDFPSWVWYLSMLLGGVVTVILLYCTVSLEEKDALKEELRELRHTMELEEAHYRTVEERREELARIRHDFNNHLSAIGRLMAAGEADDAQRMIARLKTDVASTLETPYCAIPVVNAVLEEKARLCREQGIGLRVALELPENLAVEPLHLCSMFANLVDNAIHGAADSGRKDPEIVLTSRTDGDYLFIKTTNPGAAPPKRGKPPAAGHGRGIRICGSIAGRYGGGYQGGFADGIYTALVSLLIDPAEGL